MAPPPKYDDSVSEDLDAPETNPSQGTSTISLPAEVPLLPIRNRVLLPGGLLRLTIGRPKSVRLVESLWDSTNRTFKKGAMVAVFGVVVAGEDEGGAVVGKAAAATQDEAEVEKDKTDSSLTRFKLAGADKKTSSPNETWVYEMGCIARVLQLSRVTGKDATGGTAAGGTQFSMLVEGVTRARAMQIMREEPFFVVKVTYPQPKLSPSSNTEIQALAINIKRTSREFLELLKKRSAALGTKTKEVLESVDRASPELLADVLTSANGDISMREKQQVLGELLVTKRLRKALELLNRQIEILQMSEKIQNQVEGKLKNSQREYYLRQQQKAINEELNQLNGKSNAGGGGAGGAAEEVDEITQLENNLKNSALPQEARVAAEREMSRLKNMQPSSPEYTVIRTYLEWVSDLPWNKTTKDNLDVSHAQNQLDDDHFGLEKVKKRMIEFLAVRSLKRDTKGPILCLVGPPGVGKTSLGKSVATALGRHFRRLALGGVRDEAEIRGHRRTYIGALPGNIIQAMKKAGSNNPVILLDEIDKLGRDARGDPGSALLEVLDPEQNGTFTDHYMNVPFDLSKVLFIATANDVSTIPGPLLDRMELIEVPGYSMHEKVQIAMRHLITKQMERHGITEEHVHFSEDSVQQLLEGYTREAGVRQLDREIAALCRFVAVRVAEARDRYRAHEQSEKEHALSPPDDDGQEVPSSRPSAAAVAGGPGATAAKVEMEEDDKTENEQLPLQLKDFEPYKMTRELVKQILGPVRYENEVASRVSVPGVATGMAWTQVGGEILFVEVSLAKGSGRIQVTGRLGETMQESVKTALSYVRANAVELGLNSHHREQFGDDIEKALRHADLHVHFPQGATPKDGPSAGVAITAALVSALSGLCVRNDTACTGEVTLRGLVLPVGGIKEKLLAAHRAGIKRVVIPARNEKDTLELPESVRNELQIFFASTILEAMGHLFDPEVKSQPPAWRLRVQSLLKEESKKSRMGVRSGQQQHDDMEHAADDEDRAPTGGNPLGFKDMSGEILRSLL